MSFEVFVSESKETSTGSLKLSKTLGLTQIHCLVAENGSFEVGWNLWFSMVFSLLTAHGTCFLLKLQQLMANHGNSKISAIFKSTVLYDQTTDLSKSKCFGKFGITSLRSLTFWVKNSKTHACKQHGNLPCEIIKNLPLFGKVGG